MSARIALRGLLCLAACAGPTERGYQYYVYTNPEGQVALAGVRGVLGGGTTVRCGPPCTVQTATVTNDPVDEEFWQFEARVKVRALIGIPYGREPRDFSVIGPRETCEATRARVAAGGTPTEPCRGPFYFRRDKDSEWRTE